MYQKKGLHFSLHKKILFIFINNDRLIYKLKLTFNVNDDPLANRWWNSITCYTQIRTHFGARDFCQIETVSFVCKY